MGKLEFLNWTACVREPEVGTRLGSLALEEFSTLALVLRFDGTRMPAVSVTIDHDDVVVAKSAHCTLVCPLVPGGLQEWVAGPLLGRSIFIAYDCLASVP